MINVAKKCFLFYSFYFQFCIYLFFNLLYNNKNEMLKINKGVLLWHITTNKKQKTELQKS